jgi:hypothetical protein
LKTRNLRHQLLVPRRVNLEPRLGLLVKVVSHSCFSLFAHG